MRISRAQLVHPHGVDQPLHAGPELVLPVAVVVERAQAGLERGQQVLPGGELLEGLGRVGVGAQAAGHEDPEAGLDAALGGGPVDGDDADVVEHGLAAVGDAAREVDLELAGQALGVAVAQEVLEGGLGPRADVEHLEGAGAGQVAADDVADGVAARLPARHPHAGQVAHERRHPLEVDEVELDVLAGGDVAPAPGVGLRDVGHHVELLGLDRPVGHLDAHHLVVAALALAVDAVVQPEDAEAVLVEITRQVQGEHLLELLDVGEGGGADGAGPHLHVDGAAHGAQSTDSRPMYSTMWGIFPADGRPTGPGRSGAASGSRPSDGSTGGRPRSTRQMLKAAVDTASQARPSTMPPITSLR